MLLQQIVYDSFKAQTQTNNKENKISQIKLNLQYYICRE